MLLASKRHTAADTTLWTVSYSQWLANAATIVSADVSSSSLTCTVDPDVVILGRELQFLLTGGAAGETLTVSLAMTDSLGNIKHDSVSFTVVAP
jgi:hypothetical protein